MTDSWSDDRNFELHLEDVDERLKRLRHQREQHPSEDLGERRRVADILELSSILRETSRHVLTRSRDARERVAAVMARRSRGSE